MLFGNQLSASGTGGGVKRARSAALGPRFYDGFACIRGDLPKTDMGWDFSLTV